MRTTVTAAAASFAAIIFCSGCSDVAAFTPTVIRGRPVAALPSSLLTLNAYIPDGMTAEQWKKLKEKENKKKQQMQFGRVGPKGFQSRSLQAFQQDLEKGLAGHLMPMMNAKEQLKKGKIKEQDIPYMQRGGSWDNADVKGAKKKQWSSTDKKYATTAPPRTGLGIDWSGKQAPTGPNRGAKAPPKNEKPQTRKLFGMF